MGEGGGELELGGSYFPLPPPPLPPPPPIPRGPCFVPTSRCCSQAGVVEAEVGQERGEEGGEGEGGC